LIVMTAILWLSGAPIMLPKRPSSREDTHRAQGCQCFHCIAACI
jgi:hypothetical protein